MSRDQAKGGRPGRHAFRPALDGRLESRCLLSYGAYHRVHEHIRVGSQTQLGGRVAQVTLPNHDQFRITVSDDGFTSSTPTVRAKLRRDGSVDITLYGTTVNSILQIDPVPHLEIFAATYNGKNHGLQFPTGSVNRQAVLNVHSITIKTGAISQVLAYKTANLSGPLVVTSTSPVDRIAFLNLLPGASIATGGDINTLDVANDAFFTAGNSLSVGRDLNWLNVGGSVVVNTGSAFRVGRFVGLTPQAAKGTDPGGQGGLINGSLDLRGGSLSAGTVVGFNTDSMGNPVPIVNGGFHTPIIVNGTVFTDILAPVTGPSIPVATDIP